MHKFLVPDGSVWPDFGLFQQVIDWKWENTVSMENPGMSARKAALQGLGLGVFLLEIASGVRWRWQPGESSKLAQLTLGF